MELSNINNLISQGNWEQVKAELKQLIEQSPVEIELGELYIRVAEAYMKATAELNEAELQDLKDTMGLLQEVAKIQQKLSTSEELIKARSVLE